MPPLKCPGAGNKLIVANQTTIANKKTELPSLGSATGIKWMSGQTEIQMR